MRYLRTMLLAVAMAAMTVSAQAKPLKAPALEAWLKGYGSAWLARDAAAAGRLFTADAVYHENAFEEPMRGRAAIETYWARVTADQTDIQYAPEVIAVRKLRGFVHDCGGEVVESVPGLIRVRLGKTANHSAAMSWLGFGKRTGPIDVELHLHRTDPKQENKLTINILFRPSHNSLLGDPIWRERCSKVFVELRAYLMGSPSG